MYDQHNYNFFFMKDLNLIQGCSDHIRTYACAYLENLKKKILYVLANGISKALRGSFHCAFLCIYVPKWKNHAMPLFELHVMYIVLLTFSFIKIKARRYTDIPTLQI